MLALLVSLVLIQTPDEPPRLRTVLENESVILVEPMPREQVVSVQLFASSKFVPETAATHGYRHLVEHLISRGDGSVDRKLESQGCFLEAKTLRDAMEIDITVGPTQLQLGLDTLGGILHKPEFKAEAISNELRIMRDELAMEDDSLQLSSAAWSAAYGEAGLDPLGTFDSMYRATPEKLSDVYDRQFAADGLALVISGPVDLDKATNMARALLAPLAKGHFSASGLVRSGKPGRADSEGYGECRGAIVPPFNTPQTAAALAAALAIASEIPDCFVTYTPSAQPGLVVVGRTNSNSGVGLYIDGLQSGAGLFSEGKQLAKAWVMNQLRSAAGVGFLRGLLLSQGSAYRPETFLERIGNLTQAEFDEGIKAFTTGRAVIAVGTR